MESIWDSPSDILLEVPIIGLEGERFPNLQGVLGIRREKGKNGAGHEDLYFKCQ